MAQYLQEELPALVSYSEDAKKQLIVNACESAPAVRKACLQHHGYPVPGMRSFTAISGGTLSTCITGFHYMRWEIITGPTRAGE